MKRIVKKVKSKLSKDSTKRRHFARKNKKVGTYFTAALIGAGVGFLMALSGCGRHTSISLRESTQVPRPQSSMPPGELMAYVQSQLESDDLRNFESDFGGACPRFTELSLDLKRQSVAAFVTSIAGAESRFNSFDVFYEKDLGYNSQGLFSLSYSDAESHGCDFDRNKDQGLQDYQKTIFQTDRQVECFLKISRNLLLRPERYSYLRNLAGTSSPQSLSVPLKLSAYWSVLRKTNPSGNKRLSQYLAQLSPTQCR